MTYKETLFFIGKCLTINCEKDNRTFIEKKLKTNSVNWDAVVKVSTAHYVFPAMYCNLKRADFLHYLPDDLVAYMQHITDLNRERNQQIIAQATEINELLLANNITPIFLKGTAFLIQRLYQDIAERMVGDIDFIVAKENFEKAYEVLAKNNYSRVYESQNDFPSFKHYPRLQKKENIAAVEIHKELLLEKYADEFNYTIVSKTSFIQNNFNCLSYQHQLALSIIATQINDSVQYYNTIAFRNAYDVFLLSQRTNSLLAIENFKLLFHPLNNYLSLTQFVLNSNTVVFKKTEQTTKALIIYKKIISNKKYRTKRHRQIKRFLFIKTRTRIIIKSFHKKEYRNWLVKRLLHGRRKF